jgi:hypothetical protein
MSGHKTHVPDSPIEARRYANRQLHCAPSVGWSGWSTRSRAGGPDQGPQTALNPSTILGNNPFGT